MIDASLNEVESVAAKAARGAGLAWGISEDTGKAARWLAAHDLPWAPSLIDLLRGAEAYAHPIVSDDMLASGVSSRELSPLVCGPFLADIGRPASRFRISEVVWPMWLLPYGARVVRSASQPVTLEWPRVTVSLSQAESCVDRIDELTASRAVTVTVSAAPAASETCRSLPTVSRSIISQAHWRMLDEIGARTYVASSAQSRSKGAGAGLVDND